MSSVVDFSSASFAAVLAYAAEDAPAKYVPVHRRARSPSDASSRRSVSPTPSETSTLVSAAPPSEKPRVYSIATLLDISHDPEVKAISQQIKEKIKESAPEIVMNRKMKKSIEYHAIQERMRVKQEKREHQAQKRHPQQQQQQQPQRHEVDIHQPILDKIAPLPQQKQRIWQKKPTRNASERQRNAGRIVEETNWRRIGVAAMV
ncbi:hypothetical protein AGABI2DRAFT_194331 [Agaricus bisporus var. bisporus H97]|uniref:hypothetical protein n=1 Tax=Agaricus bisporus var. bisporus (strain H97 / ATCC MYA-4626 / FGSC 10389) TaxID=936046 RepID=UPI00029F7864|nr:hypothetical protein AGABI2DRAFT_194331 [Agaricus bisporus var. bisporus H97]EKV45386.1 hypothetical protein AGABI2DRAFT_194331 [Agaricus bisporus var. bisporus H97]